MSGELRAQAARVLAAVFAGRSLKAALAPAEAGIADLRDRALLHAIALAGVRGALRWQGILARLLQRPLPARAHEVQAALVAALAQIEAMGLPPHAVVDETVAAVRGPLRQPNLAGLVNAVLRRWLRERDALLLELESDEAATLLHPAWLLAQLRADWPEQWPQIVAAGNAEPPLWLRVNQSRITTAAYAAMLAQADIPAKTHAALPEALRLETPMPVARLPGFTEGLVSVQDGAAQFAAGLLAAEPGQRVLDACAAPGGKTAHLLERTPGIDLCALDRDGERLRKVAATLERLGLSARLCEGDATHPDDWWDGRRYDRILLDAPCSATGILRRQPDVRLHRRARDIPALAAQQAALLRSLWPLLAPGGQLLYVVCSVLRAESEAVLMSFLNERSDAGLLPMAIPDAVPMAAGVQILPGQAGMDGFAYAVLGKR